jgi:hypothetical protein
MLWKNRQNVSMARKFPTPEHGSCKTPQKLCMHFAQKKEPICEQIGSVKKSWQRATLPPPSEAVPSPQRVLTSVFGKGTGITLAPWPPGKKGLHKIHGI